MERTAGEHIERRAGDEHRRQTDTRQTVSRSRLDGGVVRVWRATIAVAVIDSGPSTATQTCASFTSA